MPPESKKELPRERRRLALFATSSSDGVLSPQVLPYVEGLKPFTSIIVVVHGHKLVSSEREKLGAVADHIIEEDQELPVFAAYRQGFNWAKANTLLQSVDDLILCNDKCYGPVGQLAPMFSEMERRDLDVWAATANRAMTYHLHSTWLVLRRKAFYSDAFQDLLDHIDAGASDAMTERDEISLTSALAGIGLKLGAIVEIIEIGAQPEDPTLYNPQRFPVFTLEKGVPFFPTECLKDVSKNFEGPSHLLSWLKDNAPEFYNLATQDLYVSQFEKATEVEFSVIMPTHNRARCILDAIDALLVQTHSRFELIIVDDGSNDDTEGLIRRTYAAEIASEKIRYIGLTENRGVCSARNIGVAHARYPWIAYADSDNKVRPYFLAAMANAIVQNAGTDAFYAQMIYVNSGKLVGKPFDRDVLVRGNFIDLGVFVHRRALVDKLGGFDRELRRLVDWDLCIRYTRHKDAVFLPFVLLDYTDEQHVDRISVRESFLKANMIIHRKHNERPTVSTVIVSYNHQDFIVEAIESALSQKGNYMHEILLADDGSTDGTARIIKKYAEKYSAKIRSIGLGRNLGVSANYRRAFSEAAGEYIAILEGDDYWVDPHKNERQAAFLREHSKSTMVFSRIEMLDMKKNARTSLPRHDGLPMLLTGKNFADDEHLNLIVNLSSVMYRREIMVNLPDAIYMPRLSEITLAFYLDRLGSIGFIKEAMSVYRVNPQSVWSGASEISRLKQAIAIREGALLFANPEYHPQIMKSLIKNRERLAKLTAADLTEAA